jgi:hypothetical protein
LRARCTVKWATSLSTMWRWSTPFPRPTQASHHHLGCAALLHSYIYALLCRQHRQHTGLPLSSDSAAFAGGLSVSGYVYH